MIKTKYNKLVKELKRPDGFIPESERDWAKPTYTPKKPCVTEIPKDLPY